MVTTQALLLTLALAAPGETVLLEFSASWCQHCRGMEHTVGSLISQGYPIQAIDVDRRPELASRFRVTGLPCFVLVSGGQEVDRVVGACSEAKLLQMFEAAGVHPQPAPESHVRGQSPDSTLPNISLPNPVGWLAGGGAAAAAPSAPPPDHFRSAAGPGGPASGRPSTSVTRAPAVVDQNLAATVRIRVVDPSGHSYGTGTVVDTHGAEALIMTCGHIFRDSQGQGQILVDSFADPAAREIPATLISYDLERDIGFISFAPGVPLRPVRVAPAGYRLERGAEVFSIGCNHGGEPSVERSRITAVDKYVRPPNVEVAGQPVDGRSGGGLFSADGMLIGICNFADPADNEGIYASLPTMHWELDRIGQRRIYEPESDQIAAQVIDRSAPARGMPTAAGVAGAPHAPRVGQLPRRAADAEIICIVRSRHEPQGEGRLFIFDQPSQELFVRISQEAAGIATTGRVATDASGWSSLATPRAEPLVRAQSLEP